MSGNFLEFCCFRAILESLNHGNFHWVQWRYYLIINRHVINHDNGNSLGRDHECCFPLTRKEVFVQQQLRKSPHGHCSINQQSLILNFVHPFLPCIILGVATCHTQTLLFRAIRKSFNCENSTFSNLQKFSFAKVSRYMIILAGMALEMQKMMP